MKINCANVMCKECPYAEVLGARNLALLKCILARSIPVLCQKQQVVDLDKAVYYSNCRNVAESFTLRISKSSSLSLVEIDQFDG